jgi:hypothetical protein
MILVRICVSLRGQTRGFELVQTSSVHVRASSCAVRLSSQRLRPTSSTISVTFSGLRVSSEPVSESSRRLSGTSSPLIATSARPIVESQTLIVTSSRLILSSPRLIVSSPTMIASFFAQSATSAPVSVTSPRLIVSSRTPIASSQRVSAGSHRLRGTHGHSPRQAIQSVSPRLAVLATARLSRGRPHDFSPSPSRELRRPRRPWIFCFVAGSEHRHGGAGTVTATTERGTFASTKRRSRANACCRGGSTPSVPHSRIRDLLRARRCDATR